MQKKTNVTLGFIAIALWAAVSMVIVPALADSAYGATEAEIVYEAKSKYSETGYLSQIVNDALDSAKASGIAPADISAALSQALVEAAGEMGLAAPFNICAVTSRMLQALQRVTDDEAELSQSFSQSVQGIRAAASGLGMSSNAARSSIENCIENLPLTDEQERRMIGSVALAYQQSHAENYIPSALEVAPEPPPGPPSEIADAYDPTASSTR